jgi:subtilisin family serine protease
MRSRMTAAGPAVVALVLAVVPPAAPADATAALTAVHQIAKPPDGITTTDGSDSARNVTLITGDRVTVSGNTRTTVTRGAGRERVNFMTSRAGGRLRVIPTDALALLGAGRLDPRLFDVTGLIEYGYDDARRANVPLILTGASLGAMSGSNGVPGTSNVRAVPGGTAMHADKASIATVWRAISRGLTGPRSAGSGQPRVWLDAMRKVALKDSVPQIGAPAAWSAGFTGAGIKVGVVDTGVDSAHPDLVGRVVAAQDFTGSDLRDQVGHGTHVAATVASTGAAGGYQGVAPGAQILAAKVCQPNGCAESAILAGMAWSADQGAKVVNMSLGQGDTPGQDPVEEAVEKLTAERGVLFVVSAGNSGADETIGSPGSADSALTVGAVTKTDTLADFSSRGPRIGDYALKPDITAPGVGIVAARSKDAPPLGTPVGDQHVSLQGTSMAAPHVSGAAAILAQKYPSWTPGQLKAALMGSAKTNPDIAIQAQGAGRVDVARAIDETVFAETASISFGRQLWPHDDDAPLTRPVTYRNTGSSDVTLALTITGRAPAGMFTLSASSLTVAAGGTASVGLTADTRVASPDAYIGGHLVATAGNLVVTTPFAVDKEVESHELKLEHIDREGAPDDDYSTVVVDNATGRWYSAFGFEGSTVTRRLPKGTYTVWSAIITGLSWDSPLAVLVDPGLSLDQPRTVTLDARVAKGVKVTVPQADAVPYLARADVLVRNAVGYLDEFTFFGRSYDALFVGQPDPRATSKWVTSDFTSHWIKGPIEPPWTSPYTDHVTLRNKGYLPTGFTRDVTLRELASVDVDYATQGPALVTTIASPWYEEGFHDWGFPMFAEVPGKRTEYYTTGDGVKWSQDLTELNENYVVQTWSSSAPRRYESGRRYEEQRNRAVFGPSFNTWSPFGSVARLGDSLIVSLPMHSPAGDWFGAGWASTTRTVVERNGQIIADQPVREVFIPVVPAEEGNYKVSVDSTRGAPSTLSTRLSAAWTFRSGHVAGDTPVPLPLSSIRFTPSLDKANTAPAGRMYAIPLEVLRQSGSAAGRVRTVVVEASFDDGTTWTTLSVIRGGQYGVALIRHPAQPGFVSLRANATDSAGNTVTETVIRAYRIA